jgi:hypothetical protein
MTDFFVVGYDRSGFVLVVVVTDLVGGSGADLGIWVVEVMWRWLRSCVMGFLGYRFSDRYSNLLRFAGLFLSC